MDESDDESGNEVFELDADRFILIEVSREWPRYVATWSIRRRSGDTDFPVQSGRVERMPPSDPAELDAALDSLRDKARRDAMNAAQTSGQADEEKKGSLLGRLFGRRR
jgi:hypothetical protein